MMGYSIGLRISFKFYATFLDIFTVSLTEKQIDQIIQLYSSNKHSVAMFFAIFFWMISVCLLLLIERYIMKREKM
jgi:dolichyl-phosphate-mannose--protein O-mannosyl transferase